MATCRQCGAPLQKRMKFCSECGAPAENTLVRMAEPQIEYPAEKPRKRRKSIFRRWWFWVLAVIVIAGLTGRSGTKTQTKPAARQIAPVATSAPKTTAAPTAEPEAEPAEEPAPKPPTAAAENEIRPEVKEFLDAYEACMDEYADFMQHYVNDESDSTLSMMGDYYRILRRYTEFAEQIDAFDESELTNAELAYYLEVTNRVSQKLLRVAG